jgi:hypothetical protein
MVDFKIPSAQRKSRDAENAEFFSIFSQRSLRLCSSSALMEFLISPKQNLLSKKVMGKSMSAPLRCSPRPQRKTPLFALFLIRAILGGKQ